MPLTAADVRAATLPGKLGFRAYDRDEVDAFLERVCERLDTGRGLTADDVDNVALVRGRWGSGYDEDAVDALLDRVSVALRAADAPRLLRPPAPGSGQLLTAAEVRAVRLPSARRLARRYGVTDTDALLARVAVRLESGRGLTAAEVRHAVLPPVAPWRPGYDEAATDAFLDRVERQLAREETA